MIGIRVIRERRGLSQKALSDKSGVSQAAISDIESGNKSPTERTLRKLAAALDVEVTELIRNAPHHQPNQHGR